MQAESCSWAQPLEAPANICFRAGWLKVKRANPDTADSWRQGPGTHRRCPGIDASTRPGWSSKSPPSGPRRTSAPRCPRRAELRTMPVSDQAFVTLATNDTYCQGALVLGQSLRNQRATRKLVVLITPQVSHLLRVILLRVFDEVIEVNLLDSADYIHLAFLKRPELGVTLTKLHSWTLTHYSKCVFLDADTLVLCNIDELFDRSEFSAAPDPGWPDCFNSGVFVFQPSLETHSLLLRHATEHGSFDGADQGVLNSFFSSWASADIQKHLPFIYNVSSNSFYTYGPAFKQFGSSTKVVHFLGPTKPWNYKYNPQTGSVLEDGSGVVQHQLSFLNLWWTIYHHSILPLYGNIWDQQGHPSLGNTASLGPVEVPCANPAPHTSGLHANSATRSAEESSEPTVVMNEVPPSSERGHLGDMLGWPAGESVTGVTCDPVTPPLPPFEDVIETHSTLAPVTVHPQDVEPGQMLHSKTMHRRVSVEDSTQAMDPTGGGPPKDSMELSQEPPVNVTRDPSPQDALEVGLAISISEISIEEKVKELSPEEERRKWEEGHIDYMGKDAFAHIQEKLDRFLQ
ncbi:glycogenin-2-like isoform 1-T1 [Molossus nigricans]